jgi:hypothetical protein
MLLPIKLFPALVVLIIMTDLSITSFYTCKEILPFAIPLKFAISFTHFTEVSMSSYECDGVKIFRNEQATKHKGVKYT